MLAKNLHEVKNVNQVEVTRLYFEYGDFEARPIPENHTIIGAYGKIDEEEYSSALDFREGELRMQCQSHAFLTH